MVVLSAIGVTAAAAFTPLLVATTYQAPNYPNPGGGLPANTCVILCDAPAPPAPGGPAPQQQSAPPATPWGPPDWSFNAGPNGWSLYLGQGYTDDSYSSTQAPSNSTTNFTPAPPQTPPAWTMPLNQPSTTPGESSTGWTMALDQGPTSYP